VNGLGWTLPLLELGLYYLLLGWCSGITHRRTVTTVRPDPVDHDRNSGRLSRGPRNNMEEIDPLVIAEYQSIMSHTRMSPEMLENFAKLAVRANRHGRENTRLADWEARRAQRWVNTQIQRRRHGDQFIQFTKWAGLETCNREGCVSQHLAWKQNPGWWDLDSLPESRIHEAYKSVERHVRRIATSSMEPHAGFVREVVWDPRKSIQCKWSKRSAAEQTNDAKLRELRRLYRMILHLRALTSVIHYGSYLEDDREKTGWNGGPLGQTQNHRKPMTVAVDWALYKQAPEIILIRLELLPPPPPGHLQGWGRPRW
jgi:hypothetical protein